MAEIIRAFLSRITKLLSSPGTVLKKAWRVASGFTLSANTLRANVS